MSSFYQWEENILVLNILGRPCAKRNAIGKVIGKRLEIHVAADPVRGKATAHMVQFLTEEFQVPKSAIKVVYGVYNVKKQVRITAPKQLPSFIPAQSDQD